MRPPAKLLAPLIILALALLCAYSFIDAGNHSPYLGVGEIRSDYQAVVGKQVAIFGDVVSVDGDGGVVSSGGLDFTVRPMLAKVGNKVEVLGVLGSSYDISADQTLAYDSLSYYAVFLRSLAGAALLAFVFLKSWSFDRQKFSFKERG